MTYVGETETLVFTFKDDSGVLADPADFKLEILAPGSTTPTVVYLVATGSTIIKESTGIYTYDLTYDASGAWLWEVETSGTIKPVVNHGSIDVLPQWIV